MAISRRGFFKAAAMAAAIPLVGKEVVAAEPELPYWAVQGTPSGYDLKCLVTMRQQGLISTETAFDQVLAWDVSHQHGAS